MFFLLFFILFGYSWWRLRYIFPRKYRYFGALIFTLCFAAMFFQRSVNNDSLAYVLSLIGSFIVVFLANWVLFCLFWDLYLGIRRLCGKKKLSNRRLRMLREPLFASLVAALTLGLFLIGGPLNTGFKITRVKENLSVESKKPIKIVLFSDIHFDALFRKEKLVRFVDTLRVLRPDAVFFVGDFADMPASKLQSKGFDSLLKQINPPLGFFASVGNHEGIGSMNKQTIEFMQNLGNLTVLLDSTACNDFFCVTGRLDHQFARRTFFGRKPLKNLTPTNNSIPWFLLDHQPRGLDKSDTNLIRKPDFAFSGHTHAGQFFPATIIIKFIWQLSYGLGELNNVPWFVSSGLGQWGPPVRIGSEPEIVLFEFE